MRQAARVTVARTEEEVEQLRDLWADAAVLNIDADIDYFLAVVRTAPGVVRPHVVLLERPGRRPVLVVARLARQRFPLRLGYRDLMSPTLLTVVVSFDGIVGAQDEQDVDDVLAALTGSLREGEADAVLFQKVETSSSLAQEVRSRARPWLRSHGPRVVRWTAKLPESWDALLAQRPSKSRQRLRRYDSQFRRKYGDRAVIRRLDLPEYRPRLEHDLETVVSKSYQHILGVGTDEAVQRELRRVGLEKGWLRVWMLYIDEQPVAFWTGCIYRGTFFGQGYPGYDPAFSDDRVGYISMRHMLEALCLDEDVSVIDFGHGDAEYKERFATESSESSDLMLFANRARPLLVNAVVAANSLMLRAARMLGDRSQGVRTLKRRWRTHARDGHASDGRAGPTASGRSPTQASR